MREVGADREVHELSQCLDIVSGREDLEVAEPREGRGDTTDDRPRFELRISIIEHVTRDFVAGEHETQRPCRRHSQVVHRFATQELAERRPQDGQSVASA